MYKQITALVMMALALGLYSIGSSNSGDGMYHHYSGGGTGNGKPNGQDGQSANGVGGIMVA